MLAIVFMLITAATAQAPVLEGVYVFTSTATLNGAPVCTERWTFRADGTQTTESGQEIVQGRFHTEIDENQHSWLVSQTLSTNGAPDCTGSRATGASGPGEVSRIYFFRRNNGSLVLCPPPALMADGAFYTGDCWGEAAPEQP